MVAALAGLCLLLRRRWLAVLAVAGPVLTGVATRCSKRSSSGPRTATWPTRAGTWAAATAIALVAALLLVSVLDAAPWAAVAVVAGVTRADRGGHRGWP